MDKLKKYSTEKLNSPTIVPPAQPPPPQGENQSRPSAIMLPPARRSRVKPAGPGSPRPTLKINDFPNVPLNLPNVPNTQVQDDISKIKIGVTAVGGSRKKKSKPKSKPSPKSKSKK